MAISDGKFLKGLIGKTVYRTYRGLQVIQVRPDSRNMKRSAATKKAASLFGIASNLARAIRDGMDDTIGELQDGTMVSRFNTQVLYTVRQAHHPETETFHFTNEGLERLNGFEFNMDSPLRNYLFIQPEVTVTENTLLVNLPEIDIIQDLKYPKEASNCQINICLSKYDLTYGHWCTQDIRSLDTTGIVGRQKKIAPQQFNFELEPGCVCIVSMSLKYTQNTFSGPRIVNSKKCNPSAILKALIADGTVNTALTKSKWREIPRLKLIGNL